MTEALSRHILFLNWRDTRHPEGGGSEVYIERVAAEMAARGHRATILCQAHANAPAEETKPDGVRVVRRGRRHTVYLFAALVYLAGALGFGPLSSRRLGRPDVIVDVCNGLPFLSRVYARRPVIALVHHVHREQWRVIFGPLPARIGWWIESRLAVRVYRTCPYVTVSESSRSELIGLGVDPERITIIRNGTPASPSSPVPRSDHPSLLVLGRLVPHKRVELALRATALLARELPTLELVIAGQGWWEAPLRELTADLGIEDRVRFAGFVSEKDKHELLGRSWVALTPSIKEGWGLTIVEAAAHGTPSVAFRSAGGVSEAILDGRTGTLVDDELDFLRAVRRLLRDTERRTEMGRAGRLYAQGFTWTASGAAFADLIGGRLPRVPRQRDPRDQRVP